MFEIFKIGFLSFSFLDFIDILIVSYIIYKLYTLIKGTIAAQIFLGLIVVLLLSFIAQAANLKALGWLLKLITDIWVIAFIILFQPEIRRLLTLLGRNPLLKVFNKESISNTAEILTDALFELSQNQHGALIVVVRTTGIRAIAETGEIIEAKLSKNLIKSIFYPRSPLHDGAVIVKNDIVEAVRCTLPLSPNTHLNGQTLGMRHRAGLGISEVADVVSLIVSEETGTISVAENGNLIRGLSKDSLRKWLSKNIVSRKEKGWKSILDTIKSKS